MKRVLRLPLSDLAAGPRRLEKDEARYLLRVRRAAVGSTFVAFDPATGEEASGTIVDDDGAVVLSESSASPKDLPITWVHGLVKGDKSDAIVRDATETGATRILFTSTVRSVAREVEERTAKRVARWIKIAEEAARQSERRRAPEIALVSFSEALEAGAAGTRVILYEEATSPLYDLFGERAEEFAFFTGPEGGFEESEVSEAELRGWKRASLGARILRTETVPAVVLGALSVFTAAEASQGRGR